MNYSPNIKQVETVLKYIKEQLYSGRLQPGERLPAERRLAEKLGVGRAHVRAAFQKLEFYGIVQTFPQSGTVVAQEKMQILERMITDALQIEQYDSYHQALVRGGHNPVIASLLLVITPDVLRYYQRYRVCSVPSEEVCFEHRELLRFVREQNEEAAAEMLRHHFKSLREFASTNNDPNHFLEEQSVTSVVNE